VGVVGVVVTTCPHCSTDFETPRRYIGKLVKCRECARRFGVRVNATRQIERLKVKLLEEVLAARSVSSADDVTATTSPISETLTEIGELAAKADPDRAEDARREASSGALAEASAKAERIKVHRARARLDREWEEAKDALGASVVSFLAGLSIVIVVALIALFSDVLWWGIGVLGGLMMAGGILGTGFGAGAVLEALIHRYPSLRAVAKCVACLALVTFLSGLFALVFSR
jgi:hypothetical protein